MAAGIVGNVEKGQKRPRRRKLKIGSERPPIAAETTQDDTNRCGKANGSETSEEQMEKSGELGLAGPQPEKPYFFYMPKYFIHKMTAANRSGNNARRHQSLRKGKWKRDERGANGKER